MHSGILPAYSTWTEGEEEEEGEEGEGEEGLGLALELVEKGLAQVTMRSQVV